MIQHIANIQLNTSTARVMVTFLLILVTMSANHLRGSTPDFWWALLP